MLAQTDMLVVLLPLTPATRGVIIDSLLVAGSGSDGPLGGPILINAGRGGLQVEADISPRSIRARSRARRSMCSSASRCQRTRASGATPPSMSARTTPRCPRPKPSPRSSPGRSKLTNAASRSPISLIGAEAIKSSARRADACPSIVALLLLAGGDRLRRANVEANSYRVRNSLALRGIRRDYRHRVH